jgi:DNA-binding response OmpR family regulator
MRKILVIEDDNGVRELLQSFLEESGFEVLLATDGLQGMEMIEKGDFDLIIADVMLPYVSGIGLTRIAKSRRPDRPIICITGYGHSPERIAEEEHADYVLAKPFDLKELSEIIGALLR